MTNLEVFLYYSEIEYLRLGNWKAYKFTWYVLFNKLF